jgi:hypothetical protein
MSPYLSDDVLNKALSGKSSDKKKTMERLIEIAEKNGDSKSANILRDALAKNKKIITVSGSSRGDYVGGRVRDLTKELKRQGLTDTHAVLALMGSGKDSLMHKLIDNRETASFGKMDRDLFTDVQNIAAAHWGSTGASSLAEMRLSPSEISAFLPESNKVRDREARLLKRYAKKHKLDISQLMKEHAIVNLDGWNKANKELLTHIYPEHGVTPIQTAKELLQQLHASSPENATLSKARAYLNAVKAKKTKADLARWIIDRHNETLKRKGSIRNIRSGLGAAGIGVGAGLALKAILGGRKEEETEKAAAVTHELKSSNIRAIGYDKKEKELEVHFHSGGEYKYKDVPKSLFDRLRKVKSPGKLFHKYVKRDKPFEYERLGNTSVQDTD